MSSFNHLVIMGNLARDPETRQIPNGNAVVSFTVAVNRKYRTAAGEDREDVAFIDVQAWGKTGETIAKFFGKGKPILLSGRVAQDSWEDKQTGQKRSKLYMVAESFCFVGGRDDAGPTQQDNRQPQRPQQSGGGYSKFRPAPKPAPEGPPFGDEKVFEDDSIPFRAVMPVRWV